MDRLEALGEVAWFRLGDKDLATHLWRTDRLRAGYRPTEVAVELATAMGVKPRILPMADEPVRTEVRTDEGWLEFQEYFVHRHQEPVVHEVRFRGVDQARATPEVLATVAAAEVIVIAPSNPIVSIDPILAVAGVRPALDEARERGVPIAAVSGIIGGKALKGPADKMLASLGEVSTAAGVASHYAGLITHFVMDEADAMLRPEVDAQGPETLVTDTIMTDDAARMRLAKEVLRFARAVTIS
jgi:LPPG:FO 2-phospho-L-lactate transferase